MTNAGAGDNVEFLSKHFDKFSPQVFVGDRVGRHPTSRRVDQSDGNVRPAPFLLLPMAALRKLSRRDSARHGAEIHLSSGGVPSVRPDQERRNSVSTHKSRRPSSGPLHMHIAVLQIESPTQQWPQSDAYCTRRRNLNSESGLGFGNVRTRRIWGLG